MERVGTLKPTVPARSSINPIKMVQTRQNCRQRICLYFDNVMLLKSQISSQLLAKHLILTFSHQSFLSRDAYDRAVGGDVINGCLILCHSNNLPPSRRRHSASGVSSQIARWEGPWVHLTVTKRPKTSHKCPVIYTQSSDQAVFFAFLLVFAAF